MFSYGAIIFFVFLLTNYFCIIALHTGTAGDAAYTYMKLVLTAAEYKFFRRG